MITLTVHVMIDNSDHIPLADIEIMPLLFHSFHLNLIFDKVPYIELVKDILGHFARL